MRIASLVAAASAFVAVYALGSGFETERLQSYAPATHEVSPFVVDLYCKPVPRPVGASAALGSMDSKRATAADPALNNPAGLTDISAITSGTVNYVPVMFGDEGPFMLVLDTGSSDMWIAGSDIACAQRPSFSSFFNPSTECSFGDKFTPRAPFEPHGTFNVTYTDGEWIRGVVGTDKMTIGGIEIADQTFGVADAAMWDGDKITSGIMGMGYRSLTSAFNTSAGRSRNSYDPPFFTMIKQGKAAPVFSIVVARSQTQKGVMALGGLPSQDRSPYSKDFIRASLEIVHSRVASRLRPETQDQFSFYAISVQGYVVKPGSKKAGRLRGRAPVAAGAFNSSDNPNYNTTSYPEAPPVPVKEQGVQFVVDTGTAINYVPRASAEAINGMFDPPAQPLTTRMWSVDCDAMVPQLTLVINGEALPIPAEAMMGKTDTGTCVSRWGATDKYGQNVLGSSFLRSYMAVFDVGAAEIRFHRRLD